jgi:hypothetical protein
MKDNIMPGIRESRKKIQRSIIYIAQCSDSYAALRELKSLKLTIDSQIELLSKKMVSTEEDDCATNAGEDKEEASVDEKDHQECQNDPGSETDVSQAARQGFETIFEEGGCAHRRGV